MSNIMLKFMLKDIDKNKSHIQQAINRGELHKAFHWVKVMARQNNDFSALSEIEALENTYKYMIQYAVDGIEDSEQDKIYEQIRGGLHFYCKTLAKDMTAKESSSLYYTTYRFLRNSGVTIHSAIAEVRRSRDIVELYGSQNEVNQSVALQNRRNYEQACTHLFEALWVYYLNEKDAGELTDFFADPVVDDYLMTLMAGALLLNSLNEYTERPLLLLFDLYAAHSADVRSIKTLVCLLTALYLNRSEAAASRSVVLRMQDLMSQPGAKDDTLNVFLQLIRSRCTERITKKVREELSTDMGKLDPEMRKKLREDAFNDPEFFSSNPDWQEMLEKSGITDKLMELNKMQTEGNDVFLSSFSQMKHYSFFNNVANWFVPFAAEQSDVASVINAKSCPTVKLIEKSGAFCDSDIYSFVLSLATVPEEQRNRLMSGLDEQNAMLKDLEGIKDVNPKEVKKHLANKYIQNLYRFFNLFRRSGEFNTATGNPFKSSLNLLDIPFLKEFISDSDSMKLIGEFYFSQELFGDALNIFKQIEISEGSSATVCQKIGYCCEKLLNYEAAAQYYDKVSLFKNNDMWTLKRLAACCREMSNKEKAIEIYERILAVDSENISATKAIGVCLMEAGRYADALKYFFKAEYLAPDGAKSVRPIAWCSFLAGNYEQSIEYYNKIIGITEKPVAGDLINRGHACLAAGNIAQALDNYTEAIAAADLRTVENSMTVDTRYLTERGVKQRIITFILEKLRYAADN